MRERNAPAVLVADHRPILPRDVLIGAQVAQCVVRVVVVMPVLVAVVPAPAIVEPPVRRVPSGRRAAATTQVEPELLPLVNTPVGAEPPPVGMVYDCANRNELAWLVAARHPDHERRAADVLNLRREGEHLLHTPCRYQAPGARDVHVRHAYTMHTPCVYVLTRMLTIRCEMHCEMHLALAETAQAAFHYEAGVRGRLVGAVTR